MTDNTTKSPKISLAEAGKLGGEARTEARFKERYNKLRRLGGHVTSNRADLKLRKF